MHLDYWKKGRLGQQLLEDFFSSVFIFEFRETWNDNWFAPKRGAHHLISCIVDFKISIYIYFFSHLTVAFEIILLHNNIYKMWL